MLRFHKQTLPYKLLDLVISRSELCYGGVAEQTLWVPVAELVHHVAVRREVVFVKPVVSIAAPAGVGTCAGLVPQTDHPPRLASLPPA